MSFLFYVIFNDLQSLSLAGLLSTAVILNKPELLWAGLGMRQTAAAQFVLTHESHRQTMIHSKTDQSGLRQFKGWYQDIIGAE